ncbi:E3 ubiquitin-protein ligase Topors-like isoform 2-T3 [Alca torda]
MATESEWRCPICHDNEEDVAYLSPCLHQFCIGCAMRWAQQMPNCAVCQCVATDIVFSVWSDDDYLTFAVPHPADLQDEEGAGVSGPQVDAFPADVWADFFKSHPKNIEPLLPWLRRELGVLFEERWWDVAVAESTVVAHLCRWGLDKAVLEQQLRNCLPELTGTFFRHLTMLGVRLCSQELRRHLAQQDAQAAVEEEDNEGPATSCSPTASRGGTSSRQPASPGSPAVSQPQEEPGEAAAAGPSIQGGSRSPSTPVRGRNRSLGGPRYHPKRRAPGPQDCPQPRKRPPCRWH